MSDPSIEVSNSVNVLEALNTTVGKLTTSMRGLVKGQTELKNIAKDTRDTFAGMNQTFKDMSSSFTSEIRSMSAKLSSELSAIHDATVTKMRKTGGDAGKAFDEALKVGPNAKIVGAETGEAYMEGIRSSVRKVQAGSLDPFSTISGSKSGGRLTNLIKEAEAETLAQSVAVASARAAAIESASKQAALKSSLLTKRSSNFGSVFDELDAQKEAQIAGMYRAQEALNRNSLRVREVDLKSSAKAEIANFEAMLDIKAKLEKATLAQSVALNKLRVAELKAYQATPQAANTLSGYTSSGKSAASSAAVFVEAELAANMQAKAHNDLAKSANKSALALAENAAGTRIWSGYAHDAHSAARGLASGFGAMWLTWGNIAPLLAGAAISHTLAGVVKQGSEVNHTLETMRVLTGQTTTEAAALSAQMLEMSRSGPVGPKAIAEGMKQLAVAGLGASQVSSAIRDVINLSVAGEVDMKKAAESLTGVAAAFNISANGYSYVSDVISKASAVSKASVESITEGMKTASVIHKQYGVSLEDTALGLAALNTLNITGSAGGTALRNFYADISGRSKESRAEMRRLGLSFKDASGNMLDMVSIFERFDKATSGLSKPALDRTTQTLFGERGGKLQAELSDAKHRQAENPLLYRNRLEEIKTELLEFEGFAAKTAIELSMTAHNQMKSVASTYQAAIQQAFTDAEPYILSTSIKLKQLFNSEDFQKSLGGLIQIVGSLTLFLAEHGRTLATLAVSYVALKVAIGGLGLASSTAQLVASTAAWLGKKKSVESVAVAQQQLFALEGANKVGKLAQTATDAASGFAKMATTVGVAISFLSRFAGVVGLAIGAWEIFSALRGKGLDEAKDNFALNSLTEMSKALKLETKALEDKTRAMQEGITVTDLLKRETMAKAVSDNQAKKLSMDTEIAILKMQKSGGRFDTQSGAGAAVAARLDDRIKIAQTARDRLDALEQEALSDAAKHTETAKLHKNQAALDAAKSAKKYGTGGSAPEGAYTHLTDTSSRRVNELESAFAKELKALEDRDKLELHQLDSKYRHKLITDQDYAAKKIAITSKIYADERELLIAHNDKVRNHIDSLQRSKLKEMKVQVRGGDRFDTEVAALPFLLMNDADLNSKYGESSLERTKMKKHIEVLSALNAEAKEAQYKFSAKLESQDVASVTRASDAMDAYEGSLQKVIVSYRELQREIVADTAKQVEGGKFTRTDPNEKIWDKAGREAQLSFAKKHADNLSAINQMQLIAETNLTESRLKLETELDEARKKYLTEEVAIGAAKIAEMERQKAKVLELQSRGSKEVGEAATEASIKSNVAAMQADVSKGVAASMATAVFDGGAKGGEQLRQYLEQILVRKPFQMVIETSMNNLFSAVGSEGALGSILKKFRGVNTPDDKMAAGMAEYQSEFEDLIGLKTVSMGQSVVDTLEGFKGNFSKVFSSAGTFLSDTVQSVLASFANSSAGGAGAGGGGGFNFAKLASFFGGGGSSPTPAEFLPSAGGVPAFAAGGQMNPFSFARVNENGTEMLSMGGQDYLMTGSQGATITPAHRLPVEGGGGISHSITVHVDSRTDQAQVHALVARAVQQGNANLVDQLQQAGKLV